MSEYISVDLRRLVVARSEGLCEYCLIHVADTFLGCEVDHIISTKHGGPTTADNLAYACVFCNLHKGSDLGSIFWTTGDLVRFFHPRTDRWAEHFTLTGAVITPLTPIGEVTSRILDFNSSERILERQTLIAVGRYPTEVARTRMAPEQGL